jgi:uncharacterized protein YdeI (YjbR/CyaY-like superfamily)
LAERLGKAEPEVPTDLARALRQNPKALAAFERFAPSHRRRYLMWIMAAKSPETRKRRIAEAVNLISNNVKELMK